MREWRFLGWIKLYVALDYYFTSNLTWIIQEIIIEIYKELETTTLTPSIVFSFKKYFYNLIRQHYRMSMSYIQNGYIYECQLVMNLFYKM